MYKFIFSLSFIILSSFSYGQSQNIIDNAIEKAKLENKRVFVNYLSTSDKKSNELIQQMNDLEVKALLDSDYVLVNITLSKSEIAELVSSYNSTDSFSNDNSEKLTFPFWYILDDSGDILTTSFSNEENNSDIVTR